MITMINSTKMKTVTHLAQLDPTQQQETLVMEVLFYLTMKEK